MYDSKEYATSRLIGTIVRLNNVAVQVEYVNDRMDCQLMNMKSGSTLEEVPLAALNLKSSPLGYVNDGSKCFYLARKPMRRDWRQGLRASNVTDVLTGRQVSSRSIGRCVNGEFPSIQDALNKLDTYGGMYAVSRDFALKKGRTCIHIHYKWYGVVGVLSKDGTPKTKKNFKFLSTAIGGVFNAKS